METKAVKPYLIVISLLLLTSVALALTTGVEVTNKAGIKVYLPDEVNEWMGADLVFCQRPSCQKQYFLQDVKVEEGCARCEGQLDSASMAERRLLPPDTILLKKLYTNHIGGAIHASVVLSGKDRGSIHRPEVCLRGQGREVASDTLLRVPIGDDDTLEVKVLNLVAARRSADGRVRPDLQSYYAYWFVGNGRRTASHVERIFWMGYDRAFRNVAHRWAYIAVGGGRNPGSEAHVDELHDFLQAFYPQIQASE